MIVAIPVDDNFIEGNISLSFGRAPYFLIYNTESKEEKFVVNDAANSKGGAGIKAAQIIVDNDADSIITPRCGENAAEVIKAANIDIFKNIGESIIENISSLNENKLPMLNQIDSGLHNHGGK